MSNEFINFTEGVKRLMNNKMLYKKLLLAHEETTAVNMLISAVNEGDSAKIIRTAHMLKGAALNLSLTQIGLVAGEIELRAKNNESAVDLIERLLAAAEGTSKTIHALIDAGEL